MSWKERTFLQVYKKREMERQLAESLFQWDLLSQMDL